MDNNSLAAQYPELLSEWNEEKNGELSPYEVASKCNKKVWWKCKKGHEWKTSIYVRTGMGGGCPYCAGKKPIIGETDFKSRYPQLASQWDYELNDERKPEDFTTNSGYLASWKCEKGHSWKTSINGRVRQNSGCPFCAGRYAIQGENDLATIRPDLMEEWDFQKNKVNPGIVTLKSNKIVYWKCKQGHSWKAMVQKRTVRNQGCPYCSGRQTIKGVNDLQTTNPELLSMWDYSENDKRGIYPYDYKAKSDKKAYWKCSECGRSWSTAIKHVVRGRRCPYCAGHILIEGINDLKTMRPELIEEWDFQKNKIIPNEISFHSKKKIWWKCKEGHSWLADTDHRSKGTGCPICYKLKH